MPNRLQKTPQVVYTPAVPAVPGRPAYCVVYQVYKPQQPDSSYPSDAQLDAALASGNAGLGYTISPSRPRYTTQQICYPAVIGRDATPSSASYTGSRAWDAGARSTEQVQPSGFFRCTPTRTPVATMVGLTRAPLGISYASMPVAVVVRPTGYTVVESGTAKTAEAPFPTGATVELQRRPDGRVSVLVADEEVHVSDAVLAGAGVYGGVLLYSLQDFVDSPAVGSLVEPAQFVQNIPALQALVADAPVALVRAEIPRIELRATLSPALGRISVDATLPALVTLVSDRPVATVRASLPRVAITALLSQPEAQVSGMSATLPSPVFSALLMSGGTCTIDAEVPRIATLISDRDIALVRGVVPVRVRMVTGEPYLLPGQIDASDLVVCADAASIDVAFILVAMDSLDVGSAADIVLVLEMAALDSLDVSADASFGQLVEMLAMEQVAITSNAATQRQALQYAVNALTGAPTTYDGFDFISFAKVGGETYGLRADGLYRIGEVTDNGELISALVDFGTSDFGDAHVKRMETAWVGVRTDGQCFLRIRADVGTDRVYRVRGESNVKRSTLGKGVAGRSWSVALELVDVSFAEVDSLELAVGVTQRRGTGYRTT